MDTDILTQLIAANTANINALTVQISAATAELAIIKWFLGLVIAGIVGMFIQQLRIHKVIKNGNGKK